MELPKLIPASQSLEASARSVDINVYEKYRSLCLYLILNVRIRGMMLLAVLSAPEKGGRKKIQVKSFL